MNLDEYAQCDGLGLAKIIHTGDIMPVEVAELFIGAVEKVNPKINSVIEVYDDALDIAQVTAGIGGPFCGVPFLRKDLGATEGGRLQEWGSRLFKGYIPDKDSYLMTRFKKAGLATLGRSTVPELGISGQTETVLQGITCNPWALDLMAGGSSGGGGRQCCRRHRPGGPCQRRRRVYSHPGFLLRPGRIESITGPDQRRTGPAGSHVRPGAGVCRQPQCAGYGRHAGCRPWRGSG